MTAVALIALIWQPAAPLIQIFAGAAVLVVLAVVAYGRTFGERRASSIFLLFMRLGAVGALALLLLGPSRLPETRKTATRPRLTILIDTSESMRTADCRGSSRFNAVKTRVLPEARLRELRDEFDLELFAFDSTLHPLSPSAFAQSGDELADGRATHLAEAVLRTVARTSAGSETALLVVSDGRDTEDAPLQSAAAQARARSVNVHTVVVGADGGRPDAAVFAVPKQEFFLPNEPGSLLVKVYSAGYDGTDATISVRRGQEAEVQRLPVTLGRGGSVELQVPVKFSEPGQYEYEVALEPIPGEAETSNNRQTVFCEVQKKRMRVLLIEGRPYWDSKFLAQSLRKDERVELVQITQLSEEKRETITTRAEERAPKIPETLEEWGEFDVVLIGQGMEHVLDAERAAQLSKYVSDQGGHVVFVRGRCYDAATPEGALLAESLADLEPVEWGPITAGRGPIEKSALTLTPSGAASPWFSPTKAGLSVDEAFSRLPGFESAPVVEREKAAALVLARTTPVEGDVREDAGQPALVRMNYGRGDVAAVLGDGLWKWGLLTPELSDLAGFYDTFWSNLVRWLAMGGDFQPGQQVTLQLSRTSARLGDPLTADVICKHQPAGGLHPRLILVDPHGKETELALAPVPSAVPRFRAKLDPSATGVHRLTLTAPGLTPSEQSTRFNVYDVNLERLDTAANPLGMRMLAELTGGVFCSADESASLVERIARQRAARIVPPKPEYVWNHWLVMVALLTWCGGEWIFRRFAGLL